MKLPLLLQKQSKPEGHRMYLRRVVGGSMRPTLHPGKVVVVRAQRHYKLGDIVVAVINGREIIKRVIAVNESGYELAGDAIASNHYQNVPQDAMLGVVVWPKLKT